ncbi:MAG TPA: transcriptional repressor [Thermoanaerobaculia bacterium]|nr:transcriptional repressor [Thermoanaerobaculia bacterium]
MATPEAPHPSPSHRRSLASEAERQQFLGYLRSKSHRVTTERLALFEEIYRQHGHIDAEELLAALKAAGHKISRATVYRNLDLLVDCGLVRKQRLGSDRYLYEHLHAGQQHDHLVCARCGRVVEFVSPGIAALVAAICRAHGFDSAYRQLQISGTCLACAGRAASTASS